MSEESETDSQSGGRKNKSELSFFPDEDKEEIIFFQKTVAAVQNWFTLFGWSKGPNPISIPHSLRRDIRKVHTTSSQEKIFKQNLDKNTIYDMIFHLSGQMLPGITMSRPLPLDPVERMIQLHWQYSTLLTFLKSRGASLSHVMAEYLFEPDDYKKWTKMQAVLQACAANMGKGVEKNLVIFNNKQLLILDDSEFENISKQAWTDVLLQVYKVNCKVPPMRWVVNFDRDLLDGLVLAAQMAAYCPFLIASHFVRMYTNPRTPAQLLHNCLILVNAMHAVSLTLDIKVNIFV
ncbi:UNVERIFIED_CONTAM: hypothetical protein H355_010193 [Colinus virginianus]|nr:hypothetical protein H355_010193 [Colinus virginianus]